MERRNAAAIAAQTVDEQAELKKAQLTQQAAEARAASQVAEAPSTVQARIQEEEKVIAARADGRALAARDRAMREDETSDSDFERLMEAYQTFVQKTVSHASLQQWLGGLNLDQIRGYVQQE